MNQEKIKFSILCLTIFLLFVNTTLNAHTGSTENLCNSSSEINRGSVLNVGEQFSPGERLTSSDPFCAFELKFKKNSNTQSYYLTLQTAARSIWTADLGISATSPVAEITSSGSLEVRQGNTILFTTSSNATNARLILQQDGNFVIQDNTGKVVYDLKNKRTDGKKGRAMLGSKLLPGEYLVKKSYLEEEVTNITAYPNKPQAKLVFENSGQIKSISAYRNLSHASLLNSNIIMATSNNRSQSDAHYLHLNYAGELVTFDQSGEFVGELPMFNNQSPSSATLEYAEIQKDFNFAVKWSKNGQLINSIQSNTSLSDRIYPGETLYNGMQLRINNANGLLYQLVMQGDGNLVIYNSSNTCVWEPPGANSKTGTQNLRATFQPSDGNFVLYYIDTETSAWKGRWSTSTSGVMNDWMIRLQGDGNFVMYGSGVPVWSAKHDSNSNWGC